MKISKIIAIYYIIQLIYKFIKNKYSVKDNDIIINKNELELVPYKHTKKSNYNLQDVYDNFFNNKKIKLNLKNDLDISNINNNDIKSCKDKIILNEKNDNIILDTDTDSDNFLKYKFECKKNYCYNLSRYTLKSTEICLIGLKGKLKNIKKSNKVKN